MLEASPRLHTYLTVQADDTSSLRINQAHMTIYLGWSGSVSRLGNKPIRYLVLDELNKYQNPKNEPSSESLAEKRITTWRRKRKIWKISTPTVEGGPIWRGLTEEAQVVFYYWVRCPHCGVWQLMEFDRIKWPQDEAQKRDSEAVQARRLAWYECETCGSCWYGNEHRVRLAVQEAMGTRTKEVYVFCALHRGRLFPYQGKRTLATPVRYAPQEFYPGTKNRIPGGLVLWKVDTTFFKNDLAAKLQIARGDPGAFHLHAGVTDEYAREMTVEYFDDKKLCWLCPEGRDNHFWDCEVMALVAAYELDVRNWQRPPPKPRQAARTSRGLTTTRTPCSVQASARTGSTKGDDHRQDQGPQTELEAGL